MLRVIGGDAKGRKLKGPKGLEFRPTTGRVKEFIFSIIGPNISEGHVLDLFSGSGSLGIETLSRGAAQVTFIEQSQKYTRIIEQNVKNCHFEERSRLLQGDVFKLLEFFGKQGLKFDFILADPPFKKSLGQAIVHGVDKYKILQKYGLLIIEHQMDDRVTGDFGLTLMRQRRFGHCMVSIYE